MLPHALPKNKRDEINEMLKSYSLELEGGSFDSEKNRYWIGINKGVAATYNEEKVAALLMDTLGGESILLDGKVFPAQMA